MISGLSLPVSFNKWYWLVFDMSAANDMRYTADTTYSLMYRSYAYGALPNPFGTPTWSTDRFVMRAYVTSSVGDGYFGPGRASSSADYSGNYLVGMRWQNTIGTGTLTKLEAHIWDTTPSGNIRIGIYADSSGAPGARLLDAGAMTLVQGWNVKSGLSLAVTLNTWYWLAYNMSATNTIGDIAGASNSLAYRSLAYGALPDPFGTPSYASSQHPMQAYVVVAVPTITNTPTSKAWGKVNIAQTANTSINAFTVTNAGTMAVNITIQGSDFTGGDDVWDLSDDASYGENIYGMKVGLDDADDLFDITVQESAAVTLKSSLAPSATQGWGIKIYMPSTVPGYNKQSMTSTITLVASAS